MRLTAICMGWMIAFGALQTAGAVEPTKQDEQTLARELKETKQLVEKLSAQVKKLERQLEAKQPTAGPSKKIAEKPALRTVAYKVADLVTTENLGGALANFDHLLDFLTTRIAPEHWEKAGGPGTIAPYRANLSLVVSATPEVHDKISDQLARIREAKKIRDSLNLLDEFYSLKPQVSASY